MTAREGDTSHFFKAGFRQNCGSHNHPFLTLFTSLSHFIFLQSTFPHTFPHNHTSIHIHNNTLPYPPIAFPLSTMLRFSPTILMPGSYPSPSRNQTPPTPADVPVWTSPMSYSTPLSGTNSPSSVSQMPSSDEDQRPGSQSSHLAPARMSIRRRSYRSDRALDGGASHSGSSTSLYGASSRMSVRKGGYEVDGEEVSGEASGSGSMSSLYRAPSRMSFRKMDYTVDDGEVDGEVSGSGSSQSPSRVLTRMRIRRRSHTTGNEDPEASAQQSSDILSGSESPQSTGHRAVYHPSSRPPTPFMLNTFISMADQYAKTSLNGGQQGLTFLPGKGSKDPSTNQQDYQPFRSHQGSNGMIDQHHNLGHPVLSAAAKEPDNINITRAPSPIKRKSTPFPHGAKYNTSPARLQRVPTIQDPVAPAPIPHHLSYQYVGSQDPLRDSTTQDPVSPVSTPPSLPYQYDVPQDPFRDTFSHYPTTLDPPSSASSASTPNPPPDRHDTPSSTTQTFHPGYADPPLTDPIPYPHIRSSPLYKGPPELKHFDPNHTPHQNDPFHYYEPRTDSFVPVPKTHPPASTTQAVDPRSSTSSPLSEYPRPPRSSPEPMFPQRPTVRSPLNQRIWLGSTGSFDRLPEYTGDTPSPPRQRKRVMVQMLGGRGEEKGKKEWRERVKGWFKIKGRGGRRWWGKGEVLRDGHENGGGIEGGVENGISVEYGYGVLYGNGDSRGDGDRKRLVDRVFEKVGGGKLKERVKSIFRKGGRNWKDV